MKFWCQFAMVVLATITLLVTIHRDINGGSGSKPTGFPDVIGSMIGSACYFALIYGAGAMSELLP